MDWIVQPTNLPNRINGSDYSGRDGGGGPSEFWVRIANKTEQLHGESMVEYQTNHWG